MQQYQQAFCDNAIDASVLPELTADDLKELGVRLVGRPPSLALSLNFGARLLSLVRDNSALDEPTDQLLAVAIEQGFSGGE